MSNDILVPQNNGQLAIPDHLRGVDFGVTTNLLEGMFQGGNRIGLRNSRFRLIVGGIEEGIIQENYLDVIILGAAPGVSRVYYDSNFDPNENKPPVCYSADGLVPAEDVKQPQSNKCALCPQNAKGSKIVDGKQFKACSYFRRVVLMLAGDVQDRRVFKLDVKAQGLFGENSQNEKNLNDYIKMVSTRGVDLGAIVTRISFDLDASVPKLLFKAHRFIDPDEMDVVTDLVRSDEVINLKTVTMSTLDMSNEETAAEADARANGEPEYQEEEAAAPAPAPAPRQQQRTAPPAQQRTQQAPPAQQRTTQQPQRTQQTTQKPVVEDNVPVGGTTRQAPQQTQRTAPQQTRPAQGQRTAPPAQQRPAQAPARAPAPAPAPAPVAEAMTDDDLGALLDSLE